MEYTVKIQTQSFKKTIWSSRKIRATYVEEITGEIMSTIFTTSIVKEKDSHAAGETLGLEALKKMPTQKPDLAIIFGSPDYDYKKVFESFFKIIGEIQIIGCTSAGEFTEKEMSQEILSNVVF
ncbi:hypothetical protein pah_c261o003 [Parachlamydia acanthamoebae str. Hall's coccus]|nr:hypothetical protein pah_c261o003 [Parachlamydia acanthamoebae str. Hall's coccus]